MTNEDVCLAGPCGSYCGECRYFRESCAGCGYAKGKPFWGECKFHACVQEKKVEHCGLCGEFPCDYFLSTYHPTKASGAFSSEPGS